VAAGIKFAKGKKRMDDNPGQKNIRTPLPSDASETASTKGAGSSSGPKTRRSAKPCGGEKVG